MTQKDMILDYMQTYGGITYAEAFHKLGIARLSARIMELRQDGHQIENETVESVNRYGKKVRFDRYKVVKT